MKKLFALLMALAVTSAIAAGPKASNVAYDSRPFYAEKERGWFWYEREPEEEEQPEPPKTPPAPPKTESPPPAPPAPVAPPEPPAFSVKWFKQNMEKYREAAMDNPTAENISAYIALQRVMLDKASKFSDAWQEVIQQDTDFNESKRRPSATFGAQFMDEEASKAKKKVMTGLAEKVGIWFFFRSDCAACNQQYTVLKLLEEQYKFKVMAISMDGRPLANERMKNYLIDKGHSQQLQVGPLPAVFAVQPPNNFIKVTEWLASAEEITNRILYSARSRGLIDDAAFAATRPNNDMNVPVDIGKKITKDTLDDPRALTEFVRRELRTNSKLITR